jgi:hypothetical protein
MARTGGSTVRALLRAYASYCQAGFAVVSRCIDLSFHQMKGSDIWRNGRDSCASGQNCFLTYISHRTGVTNLETPSDIGPKNVSTTLLQNMQVDILSGQLPIGSDEYWYTTGSDGKQVHADAQYVAFFRHPLQKFVSEIMFRTKDGNHLSIEEAIDLVHMTAVNGTGEGRYSEKYSNYLITPRQKAWVEKESARWSPGRRLNLTLTNLLNANVLVGIVERMPESLELLKYILDGENELQVLFQLFSSSEKVAKLANVASKNRTEAIVQRIRQDMSMLASIEEYLKYDTQIYEFAMQMHEMQCLGLKTASRR